MSLSLTDLSGHNANVDANSNGLVVQLGKTLSQLGYAGLASLIDAGVITGSVLARAIQASVGNRAEVSQPTPLFTDTFNYTAQDSGRWNVSLITFTQGYASGFTTFNSGNVTTASAYAVMRTYPMWALPAEGALVARFSGYLTQAPQANNVIEMGLFLATTTTSPTDGVFFRYDATGALKGVCNYNGTETLTAAITAPSTNTIHRFLIVVDQFHAEFWIDGVLQATLTSPAGNGQPFMAGAMPLCVREYNSGSAPTTSQQLKLSDIDLWQTDSNVNRTSAFFAAQQGLMGYQGAAGQTMGSTAQFANSSNPAAAVPTNTTAALGTGLGGQFWETASIAVNTDGIISSFESTVNTVNITGKKLVITGISWQSIVQTVLAGGPFIYQHSLAFGHTATSLATGESAASKAPRRIALGLSAFAATAAVGTVGANFSRTFASPIVINPGEFVATVVKNIGTVGTGGTIAHSITFDAHWE